MTETPKACQPNGPLLGVKVLDLSRVLAGPFCSMILADLGAEVIKVEEIDKGDQTRTIPPFIEGESHYFQAINRNKQSIAIDLKTPEGQAIVKALTKHCDVLVENFRPGVMDRLGLSYADLCQVKPDLIMCSISGFGQTGPMSSIPSFDLITQAMSGVMSINGEAGGPPTKLGLPMGDLAGGLWAAIGALSGIVHRQKSGEGLHVDLSLLEGLMGLLGYLAQLHFFTGENPERVGSSHHSIVPYGRFQVKDGHIVLALHVGSFWRKFCASIDRHDLAENPKFKTTRDRSANRDELLGMVNAILITKTSKEWTEIFELNDVPHGMVNNIGEALAQEVVNVRGLIKEVMHPTAGKMKLVGSPLHFGEQFDREAYQAAPLLGANTRDILGKTGFTASQVDDWFKKGIVA